MLEYLYLQYLVGSGNVPHAMLTSTAKRRLQKQDCQLLKIPKVFDYILPDKLAGGISHECIERCLLQDPALSFGELRAQSVQNRSSFALRKMVEREGELELLLALGVIEPVNCLTGQHLLFQPLFCGWVKEPSTHCMHMCLNRPGIPGIRIVSQHVRILMTSDDSLTPADVVQPQSSAEQALSPGLARLTVKLFLYPVSSLHLWTCIYKHLNI